MLYSLLNNHLSSILEIETITFSTNYNVVRKCCIPNATNNETFLQKLCIICICGCLILKATRVKRNTYMLLTKIRIGKKYKSYTPTPTILHSSGCLLTPQNRGTVFHAHEEERGSSRGFKYSPGGSKD